MVDILFAESKGVEVVIAAEDEILWPKLLSCAEDVLEVGIAIGVDFKGAFIWAQERGLQQPVSYTALSTFPRHSGKSSGRFLARTAENRTTKRRYGDQSSVVRARKNLRT